MLRRVMSWKKAIRRKKRVSLEIFKVLEEWKDGLRMTRVARKDGTFTLAAAEVEAGKMRDEETDGRFSVLGDEVEVGNSVTVIGW